jgi:hypothetical protein
MNKKTVIYPITEDHIGEPKLFVNENKYSLAHKLASITKIDEQKIFDAINKYPEDIRKYEIFTKEELNEIEDVIYLLSFL